jgi:hypothetical protein
MRYTNASFFFVLFEAVILFVLIFEIRGIRGKRMGGEGLAVTPFQRSVIRTGIYLIFFNFEKMKKFLSNMLIAGFLVHSRLPLFSLAVCPVIRNSS